jgi:hypothetical protein
MTAPRIPDLAPTHPSVAGALSGHIGASWTLAIGGTCCIVGALVFARGLQSFHDTIRPIYINLGLLTETQVAEAEIAALRIADDEALH